MCHAIDGRQETVPRANRLHHWSRCLFALPILNPFKNCASFADLGDPSYSRGIRFRFVMRFYSTLCLAENNVLCVAIITSN